MQHQGTVIPISPCEITRPTIKPKPGSVLTQEGMSLDQIPKILDSLKSGDDVLPLVVVATPHPQSALGLVWTPGATDAPLCTERSGLGADHGDTPWGISG